MQEKQIIVNGSDEMEKLGSLIGNNAFANTFIELSSDLGGGKTTFTRGFARGLGSLDSVSSPTFTIGKQYKSSKYTCYHYDFYRLQEPGIVAEELNEALNDPLGVIIVEWADTLGGVLPNDRMIIKIDRLSDDSEARKCTIKYSSKYQKLVEGI